MKIYHVEEGKSEYYIAISDGIFGNFCYVLDCNYLGSLIEITLICCDGEISLNFWSDDFCEFQDDYYKEIGPFAFSDIKEISERIQEDKSFLPLLELPKLSKKITRHFPVGFKKILER